MAGSAAHEVFSQDTVGGICLRKGVMFGVFTLLALLILIKVAFRPWRIYSWVYTRHWPPMLESSGFTWLASGGSALIAWAVVLSPVVILIVWGIDLLRVSDPDTVGLAVIMAGVALLLAVYALGLWWSTRWQSSRAVAGLLFAAVGLVSGYEVAVVYTETADYKSTRYSPSGFFFGVSAIAMAINMLPICKMVFHGGGLDVDEWVRKAYIYARRETATQVARARAPPEPPDAVLDPNLHRKKKGQVALYLLSLVLLAAYAFLYWGTAHTAGWLGFVTAGAVVLLDGVIGAAVFHFKLLETRLVALFVACTYRALLISFGVVYWYLGHCLAYAVVASILLGATIARYFPLISPNAALRAALADTVSVDSLRQSFRHSSLPSPTGPNLGSNLQALHKVSTEESEHTGVVQRERDASGNGSSGSWSLAKTTSNTRMLESNESAEGSQGGGLKDFRRSLQRAARVVGGTPLRVWALLTAVFVCETVLVAVFPPNQVTVINSTHAQFEFGLSALLGPPVIGALTAHVRSWRGANMAPTAAVVRTGVLAGLSFIGSGLLLAFLTNSSIILAIAICLPFILASLSIGAPIWVRNGYQFFSAKAQAGLHRLSSASSGPPTPEGISLSQDLSLPETSPKPEGRAPPSLRDLSSRFAPVRSIGSIGDGSRVQLASRRDVVLMVGCLLLGIAGVLCIGFIISKEPLSNREGLVKGQLPRVTDTPYSKPFYYGWAIAAATALLVSTSLPILAWFQTYRFSKSSLACVIFSGGVLVAFCIGSFWAVVDHRPDQSPEGVDTLVALLPLVCIPAFLSLGTGLYKWKDDMWDLSSGVLLLVSCGIALLLAAVVAIIVLVRPYTVGVAMLLLLLLLVLALAVAHRWAANNFYLFRDELCWGVALAVVLAVAAFVVGWVADKPFVGASVGYFTLLVLLAGWAVSVLWAPVIVVYSPRVLPVFVYSADKDSARDVSWAVLTLYGVVVGTACWGVVASLNITPPYAGAAATAITIVAAFVFGISRPRVTVKMMEDAIHYLSRDTIVQAIAQATAVTQNMRAGVLSGVGPQNPLSGSDAPSFPGLSEDGEDVFRRSKTLQERLKSMLQGDIHTLRKHLKAEEEAAGPWLRGCFKTSRSAVPPEQSVSHALPQAEQHERKVNAHARILALEEAIDKEWWSMWGSFGGYLLLLLGLAARAERMQDEARLRRFLDDIKYGDVSVEQIRKWTPEERTRFEEAHERFMLGKEAEQSEVSKRRIEAEAGKARRKELLEREEKRRRVAEEAVAEEMGVGGEEAAVLAAAWRAVGPEESATPLESGGPLHRVFTRIKTEQRAQWAKRTGVEGCVCLVDGSLCQGGQVPGFIDPSVTNTPAVTLSAVVCLPPVPRGGVTSVVATVGPRPEGSKTADCSLELVAIEQNDEGLAGVRVTGPGYRHEWVIGETHIADGQWHCVGLMVDALGGTCTAYVDGALDGWVEGVLVPKVPGGGVWGASDRLCVGWSPQLGGPDLAETVKGEDVMVMEVFLWPRLLSEEEMWKVHSSSSAEGLQLQPAPLPAPLDQGISEQPEAEGLQYELQEGDGEGGQQEGASTSGGELGAARLPPSLSRKRKEAESMEGFEARLKRQSTWQDLNQKMLAVEAAIKEALAQRGEPFFIDAEFPPREDSIFINPAKPLKKLQAVKSWLRSEEAVRAIAPPDSRLALFHGPPNPADVCQGRLGDCWFLSAVAVLTEERDITQVLVTPAYNTEGIYTVRFNIQGVWTPVVVDDWIPVDKRGKPAFATSKKGSELWVMLLEKAYAKLHGSYEALEGGVVQDALVDLTGGAGEEIDMMSPDTQIDLASGKLWRQLLRFKQEGFLLGAGSPSGADTEVSAAGIVQGHAYSILQVREVDGNQLLQIRNPWANEVEWNGPWSDNAPEWTERMRHKLKYSPRPSDGVFWMAWQDFQLHFRSLYVCRIYPPEMRYTVRGCWEGETAGGCSNFDTWANNPQFLLKAQAADSRLPVHVFVTLTQGAHRGTDSSRRGQYKGYTLSADAAHHYIGLRVIRKGGGRASPVLYAHEAVGGSDYVNSREVACELVLEPYAPGYTIVPSTYAPGEEAFFVISIFTKAAISLTPLQ